MSDTVCVKTTETSRCQRCGSEFDWLSDGTKVHVGKRYFESDSLLCLERQLNAATAKIKRLEEAGDKMDKTAEPFVLDTIDEDIPMSKVGEQYEIIYDSPPTAGDHVAMDRARKEWRKAKEAKP